MRRKSLVATHLGALIFVAAPASLSSAAKERARALSVLLDTFEDAIQ